MINAIIYHGENTLVLELPRSIYDIHEKLMSIGYAGGPNQVKLTDNEDDALRVKLYGRIEMGNHLIRMLSEENTLADANTLAFAVLNTALTGTASLLPLRTPEAVRHSLPMQTTS